MRETTVILTAAILEMVVKSSFLAIILKICDQMIAFKYIKMMGVKIRKSLIIYVSE